MANSKTITAKHNNNFYVEMYIEDTKDDSANSKSKLEWSLDLHHQRLSTSSKITITIKVNGKTYSSTHAAINSGSGKHTTNLTTGSVEISHTAKKDVDFSFEVKFGTSGWTIDGSKCKSLSNSGTITLPQLAVSPTIPTKIDISGSSGNWVNVDDPKFNASWSGATKGTYTIKNYPVQLSISGKNSWKTNNTVTTSATSGSVSNQKISASGLTLSGGTKLQVRVGMVTTDNKNWGYITSSEILTVYSSPTAPTTVSVSSTSVEIDSGFSVTWSGAKAGSNGISTYILQGRAYNGSSWTDWVDVQNKNTTSYSVSSIKNLKVNGVGYTTHGKNVKFQYRVRVYDGKIAYSGYTTSSQVGIKINSPSAPRRNTNYKWSVF